MIIARNMAFLLHSSKGLPEYIFPILETLHTLHGILFWCCDGEWRAIGGTTLDMIVEDDRVQRALTDGYHITDRVPTPSFCSYWDTAIPVSAELVRWLRKEVKQLGETDPTTDSTTK